MSASSGDESRARRCGGDGPDPIQPREAAQASRTPRDAALRLNQTRILLVLTLYSPKSHKLNFLRSQAERLAPELIAAWPRDTRFDQRAWELLRRAYVDARYSPHYKITTEELAWLGAHVGELQSVVKSVCERRLDDLRRSA